MILDWSFIFYLNVHNRQYIFFCQNQNSFYYLSENIAEMSCLIM